MQTPESEINGIDAKKPENKLLKFCGTMLATVALAAACGNVVGCSNNSESDNNGTATATEQQQPTTSEITPTQQESPVKSAEKAENDDSITESARLAEVIKDLGEMSESERASFLAISTDLSDTELANTLIERWSEFWNCGADMDLLVNTYMDNNYSDMEVANKITEEKSKDFLSALFVSKIQRENGLQKELDSALKSKIPAQTMLFWASDGDIVDGHASTGFYSWFEMTSNPQVIDQVNGGKLVEINWRQNNNGPDGTNEAPSINVDSHTTGSFRFWLKKVGKQYLIYDMSDD